MAQDNDEINEARRKAMRNGEEDPVVVAQRYLNIYRQMHIFSPERKEAFDKMLLDIPVNIRSILGSLPGGLMLQDYIGDLMEKNGEKAASTDTQQSSGKPILETVLEQNNFVNNQSQSSQPSPSVQPAQIIQGGNMEISLGKDFAEQFAGAFDALLKKQSDLNNQSLEKISADLSRGQQELAQYLSKNQENEQKIFVAIARALENRQIQPQSAVDGGELKSDQSLIVQQLVEGQKDINLRLSKMESTALNHNNENNQDLINALIKSNTEAMQKFASMQQASVSSASSVNTVSVSDNTEHLLNLIEQSQAKLIEGVTQRILQNNITQGQNQTSNNANNIQINTPDTSAQTLMLVNKIADLQTANEKNMENAIERLIEAQKEIYAAIDNNRSQEIADAIVKGLQSSSLTINNYVPQTRYNPPAYAEEAISSQTDDVYQNEQQAVIDDYEPEINDNTEDFPSSFEAPVVEQIKKKKKKKKKKKEIETPMVSEFTDDFNNNESSNDITPIDADEKDFDEKISKIYDNMYDDNSEQNNLNTRHKPASDLTEKSFVVAAPDSDPEIEAAPTNISINSSGDDWGFGRAETEEVAKTIEEFDDNKIISQNNNENDYSEVEMIGADSYIYADDLSNQPVSSDNSPVIYDLSHPQIKVIPQIYDDEDEDEKDPYVK